MAAGELESSLDFDAYWKAWLASRLAEIEKRVRARRQQELEEQQQQQQAGMQEMEEEDDDE